jgi:UDPglucose 6-dehydrogenase
MRLPTIAFVGMSHLGLNYAVATASKKFKVICYDENISTIKLLKNKISPIFEKDLEKNIKLNFSNLKFTNNISDLKNCDNVYISQDVSTKISGESDLTATKGLINKTIKHLNKNSNLIILCQVPPGFCRSINWPKDQLYYQVETLIFGQALERALYPERLIIGSNLKRTVIKKPYLNLLKSFKCPLVQMNYESAELAKISINMYLISTVTTTNILSEVCEKIGGDWKDISESLKLDKRIGKYAYLNPGLGISGGNLERDLYTLNKLQISNNLNNRFILELKNKSINRKKWILNSLIKIKKKIRFKRISILGLAYKEGTHSIKNSPAIYLIKKLPNYKIKVFDPVVKKINILSKNLEFCKNSYDAIKNCDVLIIATPWIIFKKINLSFLEKNIKKKILIDPYSLYNTNKLSKINIHHIAMGKAANGKKKVL